MAKAWGNAGPEAVADVMRQVVPKIRAAGKNVGVGGNSSADAALVAEFINLGANFVTVTVWGLLRLGGQDFLRLVQEQVEGAAAKV